MASRKGWLEIDLNSLEEECFLLPKRFFIVSEEMAEARKELQNAENAEELAKAEFKEAEASLTLSIQRDPEKYKLGVKPTVAAVSSTVLTQSKYKNAQKKYFDAKERIGNAWDKVNHTQSLLNSLDKVKSGIENAIKLHGQNYFSTPYIPSTEEGRKFMDNAKKRRARLKGK